MFLDIVMGRKNQVGLTLSPRAVAVLDELAQQTESSRAEVIEAIAHAQLALDTDAPQWSFYLIDENDQTTVKPWSGPITEAEENAESSPVVEAPSSEPAPPHPQPVATTSDDTTAQALRQLQREKSDLQAQLDAARSQVQQLQSQLANPSPSEAPSSRPPASPTVPAAVVSDITGQLREQLTNLKTAYAELESVLQQQKAENQRLQQSLSQTQPLASIGAAQLNRWQYKNFSR